jgi:transposase-like protein
MDKVFQGYKILDRENFEDSLIEKFRDFMRVFIEETAAAQFNSQIGADSYERSITRMAQRNGYGRPRTLNTSSFGSISFRLPMARNYPVTYSFIGKFQRQTDKLQSIILKHVLFRNSQSEISQFLGGIVSQSYISSIVKKLDFEIQKYKSSPIQDNFVFLFLDGAWLKVKSKNIVILYAIGVDSEGNKKILDFEKSHDGESLDSWERLLNRLFARGLKGSNLKMITRDRKHGLAGALELVFPGALQQNCIFHIEKNVISRVASRFNRKEFSYNLSKVFAVNSLPDFYRKRKKFSEKWSKKEQKAVDYLNNIEIDNTFNFLKLPKKIRKLIYTNNHIERYIKEVRVSLKHISNFNDDNSVERYIYLNIFKYNLKNKKVKEEYCEEIKKLLSNKSIVEAVLRQL